MEIQTKYNPRETEKKWYDYWMKNKLFRSKPDDREAYTIVIPPPNVTGVLHMGHMLNNTIQDILVRRARMQGKNACWVPGTDHASIATEAKVVAKLKKEGIEKSSLTRDKFMEHAWEWKEKHGGIILEQLKKLGASCDWDRTKFTMDESLSESVIQVFIDLFKKGKIYRGEKMINWDPQAQTALSDEEVEHKEEQSKLYYVRYKIKDTEDEWITIATTRPETILGDTAVCVNPNDERYKHLKGKNVVIPLTARSAPIIFDEYVDMEFGTGALKVTPAHDENDYKLGQKHNLETVDIFNADGTMSKAAHWFVGKDRMETRQLIIKPLRVAGYLVKIEDYVNKVGYSQRTSVPIEPRISKQWFLNMTELVKPAIENVLNDTIQFHPPKFKNIYRHWMENIRDWCISRQLWWGHRIPAYYLPDSDEPFVAKNKIEALELAKIKTGNTKLRLQDLKQDEDVLDTWFSSWLWPISVFDGIRHPDNEEIKYYYPTNDLITAHDIIFFWVARMIISGYEYRNQYPFKNVYFTGMVRDEQGRKMSKQLGNSPDALKLINDFGADGVRVGMLLCSPAGNDLLFSMSLPEQGRNFGNKIWNAFRLVKNWSSNASIDQPEAAQTAILWFDAKLNEAIKKLDIQFEKYRLSEALMNLYKLFWDDFASWYLEIIKPGYQQPIDAITYSATITFFDKLLKLLHPFMPFITEEIWHQIVQRPDGASIMVEKQPKAKKIDTKLLDEFEDIKEIIAHVRTIRKEKNIPFKETVLLCINKQNKKYDTRFNPLMVKACNLSEVRLVTEKVKGSISFIVKTTEFYIPLGDKVNIEEELQKLQDEIVYQKGFLEKVNKKLSNEKFTNNAPEKVVELERRKKQDAETKIKTLEERIADLQ